MGSIEARVKRWGNSLAVIIPSEAVESERLKENQKIRVIILKDPGNVLRETFGIGKGKLIKSGQEFKNELRRELYND